MDEEQEIDGRAPRQRGEGHLPRARHDLVQNLVEGVARDRRMAVERNCAAPLVDDAAKRERRVADLEGAVEDDRRPERLARGRELLGRGGSFIDDGPQAMIAAQSVRYARPPRAAQLVTHRTWEGEHSPLSYREAGPLGK